MKSQILLLVLGWLCAGTIAASSATIKLKPAESLDKLREQLASNAELREVIFEEGVYFQNYLVREKWSTAIDLRVDHITVEDCSARNCSLGFVVSGNNNTVRRCSAEDVGGGVYVGGANATVEECRLFKQRVSKGSEADRPESRVSHTTRLARAPA
jgi:hypothetical protein